MQRVGRRQFLAAAAGMSAAAMMHPSMLAAAVTPGARGGAPPRRPVMDHLAWVWQFRHDGHRGKIRNVLSDHGLGIILKTHDGTNWMSRFDPTPGAVTGPARVEQLARFFESRGVPFHCWCVVKGDDPQKEAEMAADVLRAGARSLIIDLEAHEGFWVGTPETAEEFGELLRRREPNAWVGTSVDARPWEIDRVPMREFVAFTDCVAPQVYWNVFSSPTNVRNYRERWADPGEEGVTARYALDAAVDKLAPYNLAVYPIGDGTTSDTRSWTEFVQHSFARQLDAVSVWRFGVASSRIWRVLQQSPARRPSVDRTWVDRYSVNAHVAGEALSVAERYGD